MASKRARRQQRVQMAITGISATAGILVATSQPDNPRAALALVILGVVASLVIAAALIWACEVARTAKLRMPKRPGVKIGRPK